MKKLFVVLLVIAAIASGCVRVYHVHIINPENVTITVTADVPKTVDAALDLQVPVSLAP